MSWVAAAIAGSAIIGGVVSSDASRKAANTQADAAKAANNAQLAMFNQTQANLQPYMQAGQVGLNAINYGLGTGGTPTPGITPGEFTTPFGLQQFQESPAYQFNLQQGQLAIDKAAAARGNFYAPQTLQDISKFSQGLASNEFQNAFGNYQTNLGNIWNRITGVAGMGQNAAANLGGFGTTVGGQVGSNITGAGNALAAGQVGQANAVTGAMSNAFNAYLMNQMLSQNQGSNMSGAGGVNPNIFGSPGA